MLYSILLQTVDGRNVRGPAQPPNEEAEQYRRSEQEDVHEEFTWPETNTVDVENMAQDAFTRIDEIHNHVLNDDGQEDTKGDNRETHEENDDANVEFLLRESRERVFEGSKLNRLQCCIVLYSLCTLYSVPHTFVDALLTWVAGDLLPTSNCFPRTAYELKSVLMKFGLNHR